MIHDDVQSLLGAYVLDALDPDEMAAVEEHLAECPRCRSEVATHRNTASLLATIGGEAPPRIWDRISAELSSGDAPPAGPLPEPPKVPPSNVVPIGRRHRLGLPAVAALAIAAAVAAVVLGVSAAKLNHRVNDLSAALHARGLQQAAAAAVLSSNHRDVRLTSSSNAGTAQVVILPDGNAYVVSFDLPALDPLRTYQLWGLANGKAVSLGLLGSDPNVAAFRVEPGVSRLMVTAEPRGGVPQPTTPVLIQGNIT